MSTGSSWRGPPRTWPWRCRPAPAKKRGSRACNRAPTNLVKPLSSRELVARVNAQMRLARGARERQELLARERDADLQKQHLYSLFMQAPLAIVVLRGPDYLVELANPFVCGIWGRRHRDVINRPLFEVLPELRGQVWKGLLDQVYAAGQPQSGSETAAQFQRRGSSVLDTRYLNFNFTPLRNLHGEVDGVLVIASDVTDQVVARREISGLREAAEAANRAKDEFLAMLGHELRNPLAPILTALQLLKLRGVDAAERERGIIERQVKHLVRLVDDLLDVSRITRGKIELRRAPVELADVVARAIEMSSPLLEQQRHDLRVDVPRTGLTVHADAGRLAQVVANLLTNAAKYTEPGGTIAVTAPRRGRGSGAGGAGHRHRHRPRAAAAHLRSVRAGAADAGAIAGRPRTRPGHRPQSRVDARRLGLRQERGQGPRRRVHHPSGPDCRGGGGRDSRRRRSCPVRCRCRPVRGS